MQILKYPLSMLRTPQSVVIPKGARFRHFAMQHRTPMLWAEVNPGSPVETLKMVILGTGQEVPGGAVHLATTIDEGTGEVWHLHEIEPA